MIEAMNKIPKGISTPASGWIIPPILNFEIEKKIPQIIKEKITSPKVSRARLPYRARDGM